MNHFRQDDYIKSHNKNKLTQNAVPTVFELEEFNNNDLEFGSTIECNNSNAENVSMYKQELMTAQLNFDVERQRSLRNISKIRSKCEKQSEQIDDLTKKLKIAVDTVQKLQNEIDAAKSKRNMISQESGIENVGILFFFNFLIHFVSGTENVGIFFFFNVLHSLCFWN